MQAGVIHGDANIYQISQDAPPEERYRKGVNYLKGRMARQAEALIHDAFRAGYVSDEVAYHWALAILSGKSFNHLRSDDFHKLSDAFGNVRESSTADWSAALRFLSKLVAYLRSQEDRKKPDPTGLTSVLNAYTKLNAQRRAEMQRHLEMMLTEAIQGHTELLNDEEVRDGRVKNSRRQRAWKFFQAQPKEPVEQTPQPPRIRSHHWARLFGGTLLCSAGLVREIRLLVQDSPVRGIVLVSLITASTYVALHLSLYELTLRHRRNLNEKERLSFLRDIGALDPASSNGKREKLRFMEQISSLISYYFNKYRPKKIDRTEWDNGTLWTRRELHYRIGKLYCDTDATASSLVWLIRWHAREVGSQWKGTKGPELKIGPRHPLWPRLLLFTVLVPSVLMVLAVTASTDVVQAFLAFTLTASGGALGLPSGIRIFFEKKRYADETTEYSRLFREQKKEYHRWLGRLEDRPTDPEMAQWLDYDKAYIKAWALKKYGITSRDIISHVILTEPGFRPKRARVISGPLRYSRYRAHVFLLTEGGVRQLSVDLDFFTGGLSNASRTTFRYDAMASAGIIEVEVRFRGRRRSVKSVDDEADTDGKPEMAELVITAQALRLSLLSGDRYDILFEGFDIETTDTTDDPDDIRERSQDASGATDALRILEAVAAEGREWLKRERARRHRYLEENDEAAQSQAASDDPARTDRTEAVGREVVMSDQPHSVRVSS
jgi:hypothetical protein